MIAIWFSHQDIPEIDGAGLYFKMIDMSQEPNKGLVERIRRDFDGALAGSVGWSPKFAIIITWKNMTFANRRPDKPLKVLCLCY